MFPFSFLHGIIILADLYLDLLRHSKDLATTYCLKQKKENIGIVARYLFTILPNPRRFTGISIFFKSYYIEIRNF